MDIVVAHTHVIDPKHPDCAIFGFHSVVLGNEFELTIKKIAHRR